MKILLDSKDLIDIVEHGRPVKLEDFRNYLHDHDSSLVLTFNNVRELAAPLAQGIDPLHVRDLLQRLETLPLSYIGEVNIPTDEVKQAVRAFDSRNRIQDNQPLGFSLGRDSTRSESFRRENVDTTPGRNSSRHRS